MPRPEKGGWCSIPLRKYANDLDDLRTMGLRCDAWRDFLSSRTIRLLSRLKGYFCYFNRYEHFDRLIVEFDCPEDKLRAALVGLMKRDASQTVDFVRNDIYDSRAWAYIPLDRFVTVKGAKRRTTREFIWSGNDLKRNEVPLVQFGIKLPWTVSRECFTLNHRLKHGQRFAVMTFKHPQLDRRFKDCRWVADGTFPAETSRIEMERVLFAKVKAECARNLVTIVEAT